MSGLQSQSNHEIRICTCIHTDQSAAWQKKCQHAHVHLSRASLACHPAGGVGASGCESVGDSKKLPLVLLRQSSSAMTSGSA